MRRFNNGLISDYNSEIAPDNSYFSAVNMKLTGHGEMMALTQMGPEFEIDSLSIPAGYKWVAIFEGKATYGPDKESRNAGVAFAQNDSGQAKIFVFNRENNDINMIYDDAQSPSRDRPYDLNLGENIDAYIHGDAGTYTIYWIDGVNRLRKMPVHVEDENAYDNSIPSLSPLYVANEPDLLYAERLSPVDMPTITQVNQSGGTLQAAGYAFAYRYYNSETKAYGAVSLITNSVPIIPSQTSPSLFPNTIKGGGLSTDTGKSIDITFAKAHFHSAYYDSIQLFVVQNIGSETTISMLPPSKDYYSNGVAEYKGDEPSEIVTVQELTTAEQDIETASTIEIAEGRLFMADIVLADKSFTLPAITGETITRTFAIQNDPMDGGAAVSNGYYDELNCHRYRGYFRGEVYSFGAVYLDKFMKASRVVPIEFPASRYDSGDHANTWQLNWADASTNDWKFLDRESQEGSLFDSGSSGDMRALGINLSGFNSHPQWAYSLAIFRRKRIPNILGQTPIVNGVAVTGGYYWAVTNLNSGSPGYSVRPNWNSPAQYDYDGSLDTISPKIISIGAAKSLIQRNPVDNTNIWAPGFVLNQENGYTTYDASAFGPDVNLAYLFPMEYLANNGPSFFNFEGDNMRVKVIDVVALTAMSIHNGSAFDDTINGYLSLEKGEYQNIFSPTSEEAYYYYNQSTPGGLFSLTSANGVPDSPQTFTIDKLLQQVAAGTTIVLTDPVSAADFARHIKRVDGVSDLIDEQVQDELGVFDTTYDNDFNFLGAISNGRALIATFPGFAGTPMDPTQYIAANWTWATQFGSTPGMGGVTTESIRMSSPSSTIYSSNQIVIPNNTSVPFFVANIEKGLSDDRYNSNSGANEYIWTGAYATITGETLESQLSLDFDVWGGDCYITRLSAYVRNNIARPNMKEVSEATNEQHNETNANSGTVTLQRDFGEVIDMWVESVVNGHFMYRDGNDYPDNIAQRYDPIVENFSIPGKPNIGTPFQYLYNFGYSAENDQYRLFSEDIRENADLEVDELIQYSTQKVFNSGINGFDRYLVGDTVSVDGSFGRIVKLVRSGSKRVIAVQEDAIALLSLNIQMTEDQSGALIGLSSGQVIGNISYSMDNIDHGGIVGAQELGAVCMTDAGLFLWDQSRNRIYQVGKGDFGGGRIRSILNELSDAQDIRNYYHVETGKLVFYSNSLRRGLSILPRLNLIESTWDVPERDMIGGYNGTSEFVIISNNTEGGTEVPEAWIQYEDQSQPNGTLMGASVDYSFGVSHSDKPHAAKILRHVGVAGYTAPSNVVAKAKGPSGIIEERTSPLKRERQDIYHFNGFTDPNTSKRLRGYWFDIYVNYANGETNPISCPHIQIDIRGDSRQQGT